MARPCVTVVVPAYNGERYLGAALESILGQDYRPLEVILVDDGSTDGTARVARSYPGVRYLYQPNQGAAAARNAGVAASRGELLSFLDSDDVWTPRKLSLQVGFLLKHPEVGYCLARMQNFLEPDCPLPPPWVQPEEAAAPEIGALPSTLIVRREIFDRIGGFDPRYPVGEDIDWFFRAKDSGIPFAILPEVLLRRRLHDSNLTRQKGLGPSPVTKIVKTSLDRRRAFHLPTYGSPPSIKP
jgi:glycosyltransferase involved in cell wall biosynthesis